MVSGKNLHLFCCDSNIISKCKFPFSYFFPLILCTDIVPDVLPSQLACFASAEVVYIVSFYIGEIVLGLVFFFLTNIFYSSKI